MDWKYYVFEENVSAAFYETLSFMLRHQCLSGLASLLVLFPIHSYSFDLFGIILTFCVLTNGQRLEFSCRKEKNSVQVLTIADAGTQRRSKTELKFSSLENTVLRF